MTGKGRSQNKSKREEEARSRGFVGADRESWVDAALTRASRRLQKKRNRHAAGPLPGQGLSIFSILRPERAKKLALAWMALRKTEKIDSLCPGRGIRIGGSRKEMRGQNGCRKTRNRIASRSALTTP